MISFSLILKCACIVLFAYYYYILAQGDEETEFEIGDTLQVKCTSFSSKGIPVMALVDEDDV